MTLDKSKIITLNEHYSLLKSLLVSPNFMNLKL